MSVEASLLKVAGSVVSIAGKAWLSNRQDTARRRLSLAELVVAKAPGIIPQRKLNIQLEQLVDVILERLEKLISVEFRELPPYEVLAAADSVSNVLERVDLSDRTLFAADVTVDALRHIVADESEYSVRASCLSESAARLHAVLLDEAISHIVEVVVSLPEFESRAVAELLRRDSAIIELLRDVLSRMPERTSSDEQNPAATFELDYRREVARKLDVLDIVGVTLDDASLRYPLSISYISLNARSERGLERGPVESIESILAKNSRVVIRGDAGSGKTTLLSWIAISCVQSGSIGPANMWAQAVPFYVPLRRYSDRPLPMLTELRECYGWQIGPEPAGWTHKVFDSGRAVLLVDGVDELPDDRLATISEWLEDIITSYPNVRTVVTSRPNVVARNWLTRCDFVAVDLLPMTPQHVRNLIARWHDAASQEALDESQRNEIETYRTRLEAAIEASSPLRSLASNPLLCALLCALNRSRRGELPKDRIELYDTALDMLLSRRDVERQIKVMPAGLTKKVALSVLGDLARWLTENGYIDAAEDRIVNQIEISLERFPRVAVDPRDLLHFFLNRSGLLRKPTIGTIEFIHKTFQEYLAAKRLVETDCIDQLIMRISDASYREVLILAVGLARPCEAERLVSQVVKAAEDVPGSHTERIPRAILAIHVAANYNGLGGELAVRFNRIVPQIAPPRNAEQAAALASVGEDALQFLRPNSSLTEEETIATIRTCGLIGGPAAMDIVARLAADKRPAVIGAVLEGWSLFPANKYVENVLQPHNHFRSGAALDVTDLRLLSAVERLQPTQIHVGWRSDDHVSKQQLEQLASLHGLTKLSFAGDIPSGSMSWLGEHPNLRHISIRDSGVSLDGLQRLPRLMTLEYGRTHYLNYGGARQGSRYLSQECCDCIGTLTQIRGLSMLIHEVAQVRSILSQLPQLELMSIEACSNLTRLADLPQSQRLRRLILLRCGALRSIDTDSRMPSLEQLSIVGVERAIDVSALHEMPRLNRLVLSRCNSVTGISAIGRLSRLRRLDLTFNPALDDFDDADMLGGLLELEELRISKPPHQSIDLTSISNHPNLRKIIVYRNNPRQSIAWGSLWGRSDVVIDVRNQYLGRW